MVASPVGGVARAGNGAGPGVKSDLLCWGLAFFGRAWVFTWVGSGRCWVGRCRGRRGPAFAGWLAARSSQPLCSRLWSRNLVQLGGRGAAGHGAPCFSFALGVRPALLLQAVHRRSLVRPALNGFCRLWGRCCAVARSTAAGGFAALASGPSCDLPAFSCGSCLACLAAHMPLNLDQWPGWRVHSVRGGFLGGRRCFLLGGCKVGLGGAPCGAPAAMVNGPGFALYPSRCTCGVWRWLMLCCCRPFGPVVAGAIPGCRWPFRAGSWSRARRGRRGFCRRRCVGLGCGGSGLWLLCGAWPPRRPPARPAVASWPPLRGARRPRVRHLASLLPPRARPGRPGRFRWAGGRLSASAQVGILCPFRVGSGRWPWGTWCLVVLCVDHGPLEGRGAGSYFACFCRCLRRVLFSGWGLACSGSGFLALSAPVRGFRGCVCSDSDRALSRWFWRRLSPQLLILWRGAGLSVGLAYAARCRSDWPCCCRRAPLVRGKSCPAVVIRRVRPAAVLRSPSLLGLACGHSPTVVPLFGAGPVPPIPGLWFAPAPRVPWFAAVAPGGGCGLLGGRVPSPAGARPGALCAASFVGAPGLCVLLVWLALGARSCGALLLLPPELRRVVSPPVALHAFFSIAFAAVGRRGGPLAPTVAAFCQHAFPPLFSVVSGLSFAALRGRRLARSGLVVWPARSGRRPRRIMRRRAGSADASSCCPSWFPARCRRLDPTLMGLFHGPFAPGCA